MIKELFFTVPIFYVDVENSKEINRKLIHDILQWKKEDKEGVNRSNSYGWHSEVDMNLKDEFTHIKDIINDMQSLISFVEEYSSETDLVIEEMWANVYQSMRITHIIFTHTIYGLVFIIFNVLLIVV